MAGLDNYFAQRMSDVSGHTPALDFIFLNLGGMDSFKIMPLIAGLIYVAYQNEMGRREAVVGVVGAFIALVVARIVQDLGPHKLRPMSSPLYHFFPDLSGHVVDWSSFPSDTTALACALATAIALASRRLGYLAFAWAAFDAVAKLYGGYHFVSDVAAGAAIGICASYAVHRSGSAINWLYGHTEAARLAKPGLFAFCAFIVAFQLGTFFNDVRNGAHIAHERLSHLYHRQHPAGGDPD